MLAKVSRSAGRTLGTAGLAVLMFIFLAAAVQAHAVLTIGTYSVAIGWSAEPAYVGEQNSVQVVVKDANGQPVSDLGPDDLQVVVTLGDASSQPMAFNPGYDEDTGLGTPGDYEAPLIPTVPGDYTFHLTGLIRGTPVDQTVTSGDKTFSSVTGSESIQFPTAQPALGDLSSRLDRIDDRLASIQNSSSDDATRALLIGGVVGLVALAVAVMALWRTRRTP
jgi:hypothetical protein